MVMVLPMKTKKLGFVITPRGAREASYLVDLMREKRLEFCGIWKLMLIGVLI